MISLSQFKELTDSEGLSLTDEEAEKAREVLYQLLEIAFDFWLLKDEQTSLDNKG